MSGGDSTTALVLEGELSIRTAAQVHDQLQQAWAEGQHILDLSRVEAADSAGIQLLVAADKTLMAEGRRLQISGASAPVKDLLALYGLTPRFLAAAA
ncbi:MAG: STAS domain-containing protein [Pseudomonadota bacterium]